MSFSEACRLFFSISNLLGISLVLLSFITATVVTYRMSQDKYVREHPKVFPDVSEQIRFIRKLIWCSVLFLVLFYFVSTVYEHNDSIFIPLRQCSVWWLMVFITGVIMAIVLRCIGKKKGWIHIKILLRLSLLTSILYGCIAWYMN